LWRLHGARDELRGLAIETSFGYAFGLELATELVLFHLYRNLESIVACADRAETALSRKAGSPSTGPHEKESP
jgi:hypothetical protein